MTKIGQYSTVVLFSLIVFGCSMQRNALSNDDINEIISQVDTLSQDRNYHVLIKSEDDGTSQFYIWINEKLGGYLFKDAGVSICRFYAYKESKVFVYEYKECDYDVPSEFMRANSSDPYAYLNDSPFYVKGGFHKSLLVKKVGKNLEFSKLEFVETELTKLLDEIY